MAEFSLFHTTGTSNDGASAYTQQQVTDWLRRTWLQDPTTQGVHRNYANELSLTPVNGASPKVTVGTGAAIVYGFPYENTAAVDLSFTKPAIGTTGYRIVLRMDWTNHRVRLTLLSSSDGVSSIPAATQTAGTTWDITLATFTCTTGGTITLTDTRAYTQPNIEVATAMIKDNAVTTAKIVDGAITSAKILDGTIATADLANDSVDDTKVGSRVPQFYRRQGGSATDWNSGGTTTQTPAAVRMQAGTLRVASFSGGGLAGSITFPVAFSAKPIVFCCSSDPTNAAGVIVGANNITTTGFSIPMYVASGSTANVDIYWLAIGTE